MPCHVATPTPQQHAQTMSVCRTYRRNATNAASNARAATYHVAYYNANAAQCPNHATAQTAAECHAITAEGTVQAGRWEGARGGSGQARACSCGAQKREQAARSERGRQAGQAAVAAVWCVAGALRVRQACAGGEPARAGRRACSVQGRQAQEPWRKSSGGGVCCARVQRVAARTRSQYGSASGRV